LAEVSGLPIISFGQYVKSTATERGLPLNRETLQELGEELVASDPKGFTRSALASVDHKLGAVVDGLRHRTVLSEIRSLALDVPTVVVFLEVADEIRLKRLRSRGMSADEILRADNHPMELSLENQLLPFADLVLDGAISAETNALTITERLTSD
jgi:dephospho-CoA kinase